MYIKHETYVDLKTAKLLKQVGFDWACDLYFSELVDAPAEAGIVDEDTNKVYGVFAVDVCGMPHEEDLLRPTLAVAQKWLREHGNWIVSVCFDAESYVLDVFQDYLCYLPYREYEDYDEALSDGIYQCLQFYIEHENEDD